MPAPVALRRGDGDPQELQLILQLSPSRDDALLLWHMLSGPQHRTLLAKAQGCWHNDTALTTRLHAQHGLLHTWRQTDKVAQECYDQSDSGVMLLGLR